MNEIERLEQEIVALKKRLADLRRQEPPLPVEDHIFAGEKGPVQLSELFGGKPDLLMVHNMGKACKYCTLWADGFNGVVPELLSRSGFALVSPDPLPVALEFAKSRGWRFPVVVDEGKQFSSAVGAWDGHGVTPGISGFRMKRDGSIVRVASANLGPGDDFCALWHMLELLDDGPGDWEPNYRL